MRARNIKPGFFQNEDLVELPFSARLLFSGLWMLVDREGKVEDRPKKIKMALFPADDINIDEQLDLLHNAKLIHRYGIDNIQYIQVINFLKHQKPHPNEKPSVIPEPELLHTKVISTRVKVEHDPAESLNHLISESPNHRISESPKKTRARFAPPSVQEVTDYCQSRNNNIDPEVFVDHYQANGWMRGNNKIKCWKSCVRTWEKSPRRHENPKRQIGDKTNERLRKEFERSRGEGSMPSGANVSKLVNS